MSTTTPHTPVPQLTAQGIPEPRILEQRLEAIDQALVGLLPRHERLAAVAQVETRIRELGKASLAGAGMPHASPQPDPAVSQPALGTTGCLQNPQYFAAAAGGWVPGGWMPATKKKRSRLAVTAGVLGILALALMFATPVTYFMMLLLGEILGEFVAYALLGAHVVAITMAGCAAVGLGFVALLNLWRRKDQLAGHGWAITGLCTGPLPVLAGCSALLLVALELGAFEYFTTTVAVASDDGSTKSSLAELRSEVEKLRNEIRPVGHIYPASSESNDGNGPLAAPTCAAPACAPACSPASGIWIRSSSPVPTYCTPHCAAPVASQEVRQPPIQAAAHLAPLAAPAAAAQPPAANTEGAVPTPSSAASEIAPHAEPVPQAAPQAAPRPDVPSEPVEMPESAPVISR